MRIGGRNVGWITWKREDGEGETDMLMVLRYLEDSHAEEIFRYSVCSAWPQRGMGGTCREAD